MAFVLITLYVLIAAPCSGSNPIRNFSATALPKFCTIPDAGPFISNLSYDSITKTGVKVFWQTDVPADSKIKWMVADSNYQPILFTDSIYYAAQITNHAIIVTNLKPATIYKYQIVSQNPGGTAVDSGYFITQSESTGATQVYFNTTVDTTVSTGENANGSQHFETLLLNRIDSAKYSIDITLWDFDYYTSISNALINAKNRGVSVRFVYNHTSNTPLINSLLANGIPVLKREYDTTFSMHNKFWIFDYRFNHDSVHKYLWTGSANVSHAQFHTSRNNVIVIQDEALCAAYTREFEEMWGSHTDLPDSANARFGDRKVDNVPHIFNVAGVRMEVYFSPSDSVCAFLSDLILTKPQQSLYFCMLKFQLPAIENVLHVVFNNGIDIKGVFDSTDSKLPNSAYPRMKGLLVPNTWNPAADVFIDTIPGLVHHKYMIIDADFPGGNKITSTGSFNWETPANIGNDENSITIFDARINNLYYQEFIKRYHESGGFLLTDIQNGNKMQYAGLGQNYPNPFDQNTNIDYQVTMPGNVKIVVYDIVGHEVQTLVNEVLMPGTYKTSFDGSLIQDGVYFYKIYSGDYSETKRMLLLK
jgi:phosphatidylserine/phosphatidylglycerophosphate/cardiolipin synthase-like enzyme